MSTCALDDAHWKFDEISRADPERARTLEAAGPPSAILAALVEAVSEAVRDKAFSVGQEFGQSCKNQCDWRAVVQFKVPRAIFDRFFSARSGYRAHFRQHYGCGLAFNDQAIEALRSNLDKCLPDEVFGRKVTGEFQDAGSTVLPKCDLLLSLVPQLSKLWFCTKLIKRGGGIEEVWQHMGLSDGPRILVAGGGRWIAPYPPDEMAWIDVKGAFMGTSGPYQPKDPVARAIRLNETGEA